jgi:hypothetical protein
MKHTFLGLALLFLFSAAVTGAFASTASGSHAVNSSKQVRYGGYTKYMTSVNAGISTWHTQTPIRVYADTATTIQTLTLGDVSAVDRKWYGGYTNRWIIFNKVYMEPLTSVRKQHVATHELGHSIGMPHQAPNSANVMAEYGTWQTYLGYGDKSMYHSLWGY